MNRNFKPKDRIISNRQMGSIPPGSKGIFLEKFSYEEMTYTDQDGATSRIWVDRVVVRFDEHPHDYIVNSTGLDREPDTNTKPRNNCGQFV